MTKILITSGGTKVPLDPVRDITNMSKGTFGSKIAKAALMLGHKVVYLISKDGKTPLDFDAKVGDNFENINANLLSFKLRKHLLFCEQIAEDISYRKCSYLQKEYRNYDDYRSTLFELIENEKPDILILSAAVSDYIVENPSISKIKSKEELNIQLKPATKIIGEIKQKYPNLILVGFKLLVGSSQQELLQAAVDSIEKNGCDLVVANDLNSLKAGKHEILIAYKQNDEFICQIYNEEQEYAVIENSLLVFNETHKC